MAGVSWAKHGVDQVLGPVAPPGPAQHLQLVAAQMGSQREVKLCDHGARRGGGHETSLSNTYIEPGPAERRRHLPGLLVGSAENGHLRAPVSVLPSGCARGPIGRVAELARWLARPAAADA